MIAIIIALVVIAAVLLIALYFAKQYISAADAPAEVSEVVVTPPSIDQPAATPTGFADEKSDKGSDIANLAGSKGGGVGVQGKCRTGYEQSGALCYPKCPEGTISSGPLCIKKCPSGLKQVGITCAKPAPYGRGVGKITESSCGSGCEKKDGLWYKKCKSGFHAVGCCICSPNCPKGYKDSGAFCTPPSTTRGVGEPPKVCPSGKEYVNGLCYDKCPSGYYRSGLLCKVNVDRL
jgi:hypothetical protein